MRWTRAHPGAGDPALVRGSARMRELLVDELRAIERDLDDTSADVDGAVWRGDVADAFRASLPGIGADVGRLASRLASDADALTRYADEVEAIADESARLDERLAQLAWRRDAIRRRLDELDGFAEWAPDSGLTTEAERARLLETLASLDAEERRIDADREDLVERRTTADATLERSLDVDSGWPPGTPEPLALDGLTDAALLTHLAGLSAAELAALLDRQPELADRLAAIRDPALVAGWWASLGDDGAGDSVRQATLLTLLPGVLGNLDGVPFGVRDRANRAVLAGELREVRGLLALAGSDQADAGIADLLRAAGYQTLLAVDEHHRHLQALVGSLASAGDVPHQLVAFRPRDRNPLTLEPGPFAAVSVGDLDLATQVTVNVPGMGTSIADTMREWTKGAENLQTLQARLAARAGLDERFAVVAWLDYDAPDMITDPSLEVFGSDLAEAGGARLSGFLQGVSASRGWEPGANLAVVGHSYGSTTAAFAIAETPVESFTTLGSAGLDRSTDEVGDLLVDPDRMWSAEADGDWVADGGRFFGNRVDPRDASFGGNTFSAEDGTVGGMTLHGSDGHSATPAAADELAGDRADEYGYLDRGTTSLYNTAIVTLGLDDGMLVR